MPRIQVQTRTVARSASVGPFYYVDVIIDGVICSTEASSIATAMVLAERLARALGVG
jgi:hypothetical protein